MINDLPESVFQYAVLPFLSSREIFSIRGVSKYWRDSVKIAWINVVKEEMLSQVNSLDLIYEKETTSKLLEFKFRYLKSYTLLMIKYFYHINLEDITRVVTTGPPSDHLLSIVTVIGKMVDPRIDTWEKASA